MAKASFPANEPTSDLRSRILHAALRLIREEGPEATTIRAVAEAAVVQVPAIYRLFGDKKGLLNAVVEQGAGEYLLGKAARTVPPDPVEALRCSWDSHVAFGLADPGLFAIMSTNPDSPAAAEGMRVLRNMVHRIAAAGRLRTSEERAVAMIRACCIGLVTTLVADGTTGAGAISIATREAVFAAITMETGEAAPATREVAAATLRAQLDQPSGLSRGQLALLDEMLEHLSEARQAPPAASFTTSSGSRSVVPPPPASPSLTPAG